MRILLLALVMAVTLSGCGNEVGSNPVGKSLLQTLVGLKSKLSPPPVTGDPNDPGIRQGILNFRAGLQNTGKPIILASTKSLQFGTLLTPFGGNNGIVTWSSTGYQTISLRDGVMVATRGFGPDMMSSVLPTIAAIAAGKGMTQRHYSYLDGGDQLQTLDYTCVLATAGAESIEVMAKGYTARKVTEKCSGSGPDFTNVYWFDKGTNLRQSNQFFAPGMTLMFIQRVID